MNELHEIQMQILQKLLFNPGLRYTDLRPDSSIENNKLNFHINKLEELQLIHKTEDKYSLTAKGKEFAGRIDTDRAKIQRQAKISAWVCVTRDTDKGLEILIGTRLKHPFYGCQGFLSGKANYGEQIVEAAKREMKEETNYEGEPHIVALKHYRVFDPNTKELLEDKFMFLCHVHNPKGELTQPKEAHFDWVLEKELPKFITQPFESIEEFLGLVNMVKNFNNTVQIIEEERFSDKF
jgi:ADP-ribose pyrophosphatase YjhB (NUDIX family)/predicted transcriptional regulator